MLSFKQIFIPIIVFLLGLGCSNNHNSVEQTSTTVYSSQSTDTQTKDTANLTDQKGLKQGRWVIESEDGHTEEGFYKDGKKQGVWTGSRINIDLSKTTYTVLYKNDSLQKIN